MSDKSTSDESRLKARQEARNRAQGRADQELRSYLEDAKRALNLAQALCSRIARSTDEEDAVLVDRARQNRVLLNGLQNQLGRVGTFKDSLSTDVDLLPESVRADMAREKNLRQRVADAARTRVRDTEQAVANVLQSLARGKS